MENVARISSTKNLIINGGPLLTRGSSLGSEVFQTIYKSCFQILKYEINQEYVFCSSYFFSLNVGAYMKMKINETRLENMATYTRVPQRQVLHFAVLYDYRDSNFFTSKSVLLF